MLAVVAAMLTTAPAPVLAGYLPAWRTAQYDFERLAPLTDVLYFSIQPRQDGSLDLKDIRQEDFPRLRQAKQKHRFRLLICVGGWERSAGFMATASNPEARARFVRESVAFCDKYGFDGVDLDWEHPKTPEEGRAYGTLIQALRTALAPKKRIVTAAIASWQTMSAEAVEGLDRVHLMSYDHPQRHATFEAAVSDVQKLRVMGFPASKIVLGVPFYGRSLSNWNDAKSYAELASEHKPSADLNEAGGYFFNGPETLRRKAELVRREGLGGVMIWEVTQDAPGSGSLLGVLRRALRP